MGITIANTNRSITLVNVTDYNFKTQVKRAVYSIPGKTTPTVDEDTQVVNPTMYKITAFVNKFEMLILTIMRTENNLAFTLADGIQATKNVDLEDIDITAQIGKTGTEPDSYVAMISLTGRDH